MKYCSKCGNEMFDEAIVCTKCGCAVCTKCGQALSAEEKFCIHCGTPVNEP